jgi:hypothetical protein
LDELMLVFGPFETSAFICVVPMDELKYFKSETYPLNPEPWQMYTSS